MLNTKTEPESPVRNRAEDSLIDLAGIYRFYENGGARTFVLNGISLSIQPGEFVSIMGPSGAGKSTLLHILGLLDIPDHGEYHLQGQNVTCLKEKERARIHRQSLGFVFQSYHLIDDLTVYENLETPLLYKGLGHAERQALIADTLDRFQIVGKRDLFPSQLSGGQQQLVGVARAVITNPQLILADEPTGNLNSKQGREIMELFTELNAEGTTIIQATHSEKNAAYGKRIINLLDGRIT
jgi:putative ABC transport system ATP-binding protein